jgi:hypothetical protein
MNSETASSSKDRRDEVELASFLVPPSSETQEDMMSYHIEASKRLTRTEERERDSKRVIRLPPGWDMQKIKQTLKLGLAAIVCFALMTRILHHVHSASHERTSRQPVVFNGYSLKPDIVEKANNYRVNETALIVNLHLGIMHSSTEYKDDVFDEEIVLGEDFICKLIGRSFLVNQLAPRFHCRIDIHQDQLHVAMGPNFPPKTPWAFEETSDNIKSIRNYWHMIDWYNNDADIIQEDISSVTHVTGGNETKQRFLSDTNWKDPNLISILVMVDPMERLLADSWSFFERAYPAEDASAIINDRSVGSKPWWTFVNENPDNYVVQQLGQRHTNTKHVKDKELLKKAKELLEEFTFVLDNACLGQGVIEVADILNIIIGDTLPPQSNATLFPKTSMPIDVYQKLIQLNQLDIELYKWSKTISLVQC